jgi:hypothetical protein
MKRATLILTLALVVAMALPATATILASRVTVAATATAIVSGLPSNPTAAVVVNQCTASVFLGGSGVTTSAGLELTTGSTFSIVLWPEETLYGIVASSTCRVDVLQNRR